MLSSWYWFHAIVFGKDTWYNFYLLKFVKTCLWLNIWSILESIPCVLERNILSAAIGWNVLWLSVGFIWPPGLFRSTVSLFPLCPEDLSVAESGALKSSTTAVLLFISPFSSVSVYTFRCCNVECINIYNCYIFLVNWPLYYYTMTLFLWSFKA